MKTQVVVREYSIMDAYKLTPRAYQWSPETETALDWEYLHGTYAVFEISFSMEDVPEGLKESLVGCINSEYPANNVGCTLDWYGIKFKEKRFSVRMCGICNGGLPAKEVIPEYRVIEKHAICRTCYNKARKATKKKSFDDTWMFTQELTKRLVKQLADNGMECPSCLEKGIHVKGDCIGAYTYGVCDACAKKECEDEDRYNEAHDAEIRSAYDFDRRASISEYYASRLESYDPRWDE